MPVIPFQERQIINRPVEVPTISPIAAGMAGAQVEVAGRQLANLGSSMTDFAAAQRKAEQVLELSTAKVNLDTDLDTFKSSFETRTDHQQFKPDYEDYFGKVREQYQQHVSPDVWRVFQPTVENKIAQTRAAIDHHGRKLFIQEGVSQVESNYNEAAKQYAYLSDPTDRQLKRAQIELDLGGAVASGFIRPDQRDKLLMNLDNHADKFSSEMLIQQNPPVAYAALSERDQSGQYVNYPALRPEERAQRLKEAENASWTRYARLEKQERELQEDVKLKSYNMLDAVEAGKMTPKAFLAEIDRATQRDPVTGIRAMTPDTGRYMKRELERTLKGEGGEGKSNMAVYSQLSQDSLKVRDGSMSYAEQNDAILKAAASGQLSRGDTKLLLNQARTESLQFTKADKASGKAWDKQKDIELKSIKKNIIEKGWGKDLSNRKKAELGRALYEFDQYADTVEDEKGLQLAKKYADTLVEWGQKGQIKRAIEYIFKPDEVAAQAAPTTTPKTIEVPPGWKPTGEKYQGKPVYLDENGVKKVWQ